jgi:hypothetical protein
MKHYRFYTTKTKVRKKWYARALALIEIKKGLMELLGIELRNLLVAGTLLSKPWVEMVFTDSIPGVTPI